MYSEQEIADIEQLKLTAKALDQDEGIRIEGGLPNLENGGFVFVTHYRSRYCVNICDRKFDEKIGKYVPGGNDKWQFFEKFEDAWALVEKSIRRPMKAWVY